MKPYRGSPGSRCCSVPAILVLIAGVRPGSQHCPPDKRDGAGTDRGSRSVQRSRHQLVGHMMALLDPYYILRRDYHRYTLPCCTGLDTHTMRSNLGNTCRIAQIPCVMELHLAVAEWAVVLFVWIVAVRTCLLLLAVCALICFWSWVLQRYAWRALSFVWAELALSRL